MPELSSNLTFDKQETVVLAHRVPGSSASASAELEHALRATSIVLTVDARASAGGSLALTAEESDDGESWSEIEAIGTLTRTGSASLTVTPTLDWLRVAWEGGAGWTIDITATGHATIEAGNIASGGTPSAPLTLQSGVDQAELVIVGTSPGDNNQFALNLGGTTPGVFAQAYTDGTRLTVGPETGGAGNAGRVTVAADDLGATGIASLTVSADAGGQLITLAGGLDYDLLAAGAGSVGRLRINKNGYLIVQTVAAPADADLAASEMALWFDDTNGAAKLMVKAKTANGTVRTGSLNLS